MQAIKQPPSPRKPAIMSRAPRSLAVVTAEQHNYRRAYEKPDQP